jgi:hypothetical protein
LIVRIADVLGRYAHDVTTVLDVTSASMALDLRPYVHLPVGVEYETSDNQAAVPVPDRALVLGLVGPNTHVHAPLERFTQVLPRLQVGARGLLLLGWALDELPAHRLLDPLVAASCQVLEIVPLDYEHIFAGLVLRRVDALAHVPPYLGANRDQDAAFELDSLRPQLRLANEYVFTDFAARRARTRLEAAESALRAARGAPPASSQRDTTQVEELRRENRRLTGERDRLMNDLGGVRARLVALETSTAYQVGVTLADVRRAPARQAVQLPSRMWRLYRDRVTSASREGVTRALAPRPVPVLDEPSSTAEPALLTGIATSFSPKTRLALAGVLRDETAAAFAPEVDLLQLTPNVGLLLLERSGSDLLLVESAVARAGSPWAFAGTPSGTNRDGDLAALLDGAHALGIPTVFWWTSPVHEAPGLQRVAQQCDLVLGEPGTTDDALAGLSRGLQLRRFNLLGVPPVRRGVVHVGSFDRRVPRAAVEPLLNGLRAANGGDLIVHGDFSPYVEGPVRRCGFPEDLAGAVAGDRSWRDLPGLYRRSAAAFATSAAWITTGDPALDVRDAEKLACGARLIHPSAEALCASLGIRTGSVVGPVMGGYDSLEALEAAQVWPVLRALFPSATSAVELDRLVRALGLSHTPLAGRAVSVVARVSIGDDVGHLVAGVLGQRHRPVELLAVVDDPTELASAAERLSEAQAAGVAVRPVLSSDVAAPQALAASARAEWISYWGDRPVQNPAHLLDLLIGAEITGASAVGRGARAGYVTQLPLAGSLLRRSAIAVHHDAVPTWDETADLEHLAQVGQQLFSVSEVGA